LHASLFLDVEINVLVNVELADVLATLGQDGLDLLLGEAAPQVALKLLEQDRGALLTALAVTNGVVDLDLFQDGAVVKCDLQGVANVTLIGSMVLSGEAGILNTLHLGAERINAGIRGNFVAVVLSNEAAVDQGHGNHVLDAVVAVSVVVQGSLLVNNAHGSLLGADADMLNVVGGESLVLESLMQSHGGLGSGLGVELGREGDLEKNVLHDVRAVVALELELVALKEDIVEAPGFSSKNGGHSTLTALDDESKVNSTRNGITSGPRLTGHGVGGVTVSTESLAINKGLGDSINGLLLGQAEHLGNNGGSGNLNQDNVVKTDLVEGVLESQNTLDLVSLDHALEHVLDLEDLAALDTGLGRTGEPVSHGQDTTEVIGRMSPLGCEPAVIEI